MGACEATVEAKILELLECRDAGKTICPSEVARAMAGSDKRSDWQPLMEATRAAARRLEEAGQIVITQHGRVVDPARAQGPIRLRKV
jgi:phage terminase large subunit-like protein